MPVILELLDAAAASLDCHRRDDAIDEAGVHRLGNEIDLCIRLEGRDACRIHDSRAARAQHRVLLAHVADIVRFGGCVFPASS